MKTIAICLWLLHFAIGARAIHLSNKDYKERMARQKMGLDPWEGWEPKWYDW